MTVELRIPQAGESIAEVQIGGWRKAEGDYVRVDEVLVELETDKASLELPAPVSGRIARLLKQAGELASVGEVICLIEEAPVPAAAAAEPRPAQGDRSEARATATPAAGGPPPAEAAQVPRHAADARVMPAARRALAELGLSPSDVTATGPGGRLLKEDVMRHAATQRAAPAHAPEAAPAPAPSPAIPPAVGRTDRSEAGLTTAAPALPGARQEEAVPMTMLRRRIAERLVQAQRTAALLTTFNEIDLSAVRALREERGAAFEKEYGIKLGFMSFFVKAAIDALKLIPAVNAEIRELPMPDGRVVPHIVYKNYFDIGVAVSTEQGLVVPVIRNAERLSFAEVEKAIADLATRARDRTLSLEELQGGTFTISNGGVFGSLMSTPIVNPPQSAILGLHVIQDRPVARDGQVVIRPMMYVALSYDHRIIDGRESVTFLKRIKECIEEPSRMLIEV